MSAEIKKEVRESWKTPLVMGSMSAVVLVFFGIIYISYDYDTILFNFARLFDIDSYIASDFVTTIPLR